MGELQDKVYLGAEKMRGKFGKKRENSGQIHTCEVSLRRCRETSETEMIRGTGKILGKRLGKNTY
jgi:hypothetical protein